jgi:hypothetical protein
MVRNDQTQNECDAKLELVARDYDVLYKKYTKYKNMAILMQGKGEPF